MTYHDLNMLLQGLCSWTWSLCAGMPKKKRALSRDDKKHVMLCPRSRHLELTLTAIAKAVWIQAFLKCLTFNCADSSDLEWLLYSECDYKIWKVVHVALRFCAHFRYSVFVPYYATADRKGRAYTVILF